MFIILNVFLSTINSLNNKIDPCGIAILVQNKQDEAKIEKKTSLIWIPEHSGIKGNETAEKLNHKHNNVRSKPLR